jgi:hypothetical protein
MVLGVSDKRMLKEVLKSGLCSKCGHRLLRPSKVSDVV